MLRTGLLGFLVFLLLADADRSVAGLGSASDSGLTYSQPAVVTEASWDLPQTDQPEARLPYAVTLALWIAGTSTPLISTSDRPTLLHPGAAGNRSPPSLCV